jgi:anti-sigma regulatory factor (Ser/Thr protein kinase)
VLDSQLRDIETLAEEVDLFATDTRLSPDIQGEIQLALEEIVSNVIKHGCRGQAGKPIEVSITRDNDTLTLIVEDCAMPFNPLSVPEPDLNKPMEEKQPGGLGVHLVRQLMSSVEYQFVDGKNRLIMRKQLTTD